MYPALPTLNICEPLFSQTKLSFTDRRKQTDGRKRLVPRRLEILMMLKDNKHRWSAATVESCLNVADSTQLSYDYQDDSDNESEIESETEGHHVTKDGTGE